MAIYLIHLPIGQWMVWAYNKAEFVPFNDPGLVNGCNDYEEDSSEMQACKDAGKERYQMLVMKWWMILVVMPITIALAALMFYFVEEPMRKRCKSK